MLQHHDFSDSPARCTGCGCLAVGPCARCQAPLCGDCCVIVEGGARPYAVCSGCEGRLGGSLQGPWVQVLWWVLGPMLLLAVAVAGLAWIAAR